jgi:hypothetical protein
MRTVVVGVVGVVGVTLALAPARAWAEEPRTVDFAAGLVAHQPVDIGGRDHDGIPALGLELRGYAARRARGLWLSGLASWEPSVDASNPERVELVNAVAAGGALGGFVDLDLGTQVTLYGGARVEWLHAGGDNGLRYGPLASVGVVIGHWFGHPMALEAKVSVLQVSLGGASPRLWQGGLFLTGVLFPDRPL